MEYILYYNSLSYINILLIAYKCTIELIIRTAMQLYVYKLLYKCIVPIKKFIEKMYVKIHYAPAYQ